MIILVTILLIVIILKLFFMADDLKDIKAEIVSAKEKVVKVAADVASLHAKIDSITAASPTADEWAEVKGMAADLNTSLQVIDDATADEPVAPPPAPEASADLAPAQPPAEG